MQPASLGTAEKNANALRHGERRKKTVVQREEHASCRQESPSIPPSVAGSSSTPASCRAAAIPVHNHAGQHRDAWAPLPDYPHGLAYTKHAEISLEEMEAGNIVITDIPTSRIVWGERMTSVGHNLSREILRLRPDIGATIHVHDDATIALLGSGAPHGIQGPVARSRPSCWDQEAGAFRVRRMSMSRPMSASVAGFIQDTNLVDAGRPGLTALGRNVSEAYHRLQHLHRRGAALPDGRAGRGASRARRRAIGRRRRSKRCTASPSASSPSDARRSGDVRGGGGVGSAPRWTARILRALMLASAQRKCSRSNDHDGHISIVPLSIGTQRPPI